MLTAIKGHKPKSRLKFVFGVVSDNLGRRLHIEDASPPFEER